ncbi:MAG: hypothetical protein KAY22_23515 [Rhizorhabdus sp.]|uniref:DUF6874 family protein n=1 Tax=Rhizorhabdus sp. TaxID=1968843 RepID=UPI001B4FC5A0|nr:hypothetical protein [Rhizorhabdus sp.]MBP8235269.1 hypothetical protein [Rhizorhabdus sp.]
MSDVSFEIAPGDAKLVEQIADYWSEACHAAIGRRLTRAERLEVRMDLTATHANGCPLDFQKMLDASTATLAHDITGIARHLDRTTGRLTDHFLPRCAQRAEYPARDPVSVQ